MRMVEDIGNGRYTRMRTQGFVNFDWDSLSTLSLGGLAGLS